jgi:copper(I)-binding protein
MIPLRTRLLALVVAFLAVPAAAQDYRVGSLEIGHPWARATPPTAPTGGGFLTVTNTGTTPDQLISAKSAAAETVQIHEMKMDGNVMRMREREAASRSRPARTVTLAPGHFHLMMMG